MQVGGIVINNQEIGLSTNEPGQNFVVARFDGIMGLSYPTISAGGETPVMDNMMSQNLLQANMFAFYLSRYSRIHCVSATTSSLLLFFK